MYVKQIWISEEAYEYIRKMAFDNRISMLKAGSQAVLNNVEKVE
jgi:AmiR/NasT family two-component response regulator